MISEADSIPDHLFNQMLLQVVDITYWFLINSVLSYAFSCYLQTLGWFGCHGAKVIVNGAYYRDVVLSKQSSTAGDFCTFQQDLAHCMCARGH